MAIHQHIAKSSCLLLTACGMAAIAACTLALAACHPSQIPQPSATAAAPAATAAAPAPSTVAHLTSPFAVPSAAGAASQAGAHNFDDLLAHFPEATRAQIRTWYAQHAAGSMAFTSNAQWQWMRQHDYPTPDDVLRAASMSDAQLRELALRGDTKANFFYLARLLDNAAQPSSDKTRMQAEMKATMDRALASGSAFAGYMFGNYYATIHAGNATGLGEAAGLMWVASMGDKNGPFHSTRMAMGFPGVSGVRAAEVYFDMFAAAARINPYFLNARRGRGELSIPLQ